MRSALRDIFNHSMCLDRSESHYTVLYFWLDLHLCFLAHPNIIKNIFWTILHPAIVLFIMNLDHVMKSKQGQKWPDKYINTYTA